MSEPVNLNAGGLGPEVWFNPDTGQLISSPETVAQAQQANISSGMFNAGTPLNPFTTTEETHNVQPGPGFGNIASPAAVTQPGPFQGGILNLSGYGTAPTSPMMIAAQNAPAPLLPPNFSNMTPQPGSPLALQQGGAFTNTPSQSGASGTTATAPASAPATAPPQTVQNPNARFYYNPATGRYESYVPGVPGNSPFATQRFMMGDPGVSGPQQQAGTMPTTVPTTTPTQPTGPQTPNVLGQAFNTALGPNLIPQWQGAAPQNTNNAGMTFPGTDLLTQLAGGQGLGIAGGGGTTPSSSPFTSGVQQITRGMSGNPSATAALNSQITALQQATASGQITPEQAANAELWTLNGVDVRQMLPKKAVIKYDAQGQAVQVMEEDFSALPAVLDLIRQQMAVQQQADQNALEALKIQVNQAQFDISARLQALAQLQQAAIATGNWDDAFQAREQTKYLTMLQLSLEEKKTNLQHQQFLLSNPMAIYAQARLMGKTPAEIASSSNAAGNAGGTASAPFGFTQNEQQALNASPYSLSYADYSRLRPSAQQAASMEAGYAGLTPEDFTNQLRASRPASANPTPRRRASARQEDY